MSTLFRLFALQQAGKLAVALSYVATFVRDVGEQAACRYADAFATAHNKQADVAGQDARERHAQLCDAATRAWAAHQRTGRALAAAIEQRDTFDPNNHVRDLLGY